MKVIKFRGKKCLYFENGLFRVDGSNNDDSDITKNYFFVDEKLICNYLNWDVVYRSVSYNECILYKKAEIFNADERNFLQEDNVIIIRNKDSDTEYNIGHEFVTHLRKEKIKNILN